MEERWRRGRKGRTSKLERAMMRGDGVGIELVLLWLVAMAAAESGLDLDNQYGRGEIHGAKAQLQTGPETHHSVDVEQIVYGMPDNVRKEIHVVVKLSAYPWMCDMFP